MISKEIKYIGFYGLSSNIDKRVSSLAAITKMNYISGVLTENGYKVSIVSPSWSTDDTKCNFAAKKNEKIGENINLILGATWKTRLKLMRNIKIIYSLFWLLSYLIFNTKRGDSILVYHSPWISLPIVIAKKIKKLNLILEVEEIYKDVSVINKYFIPLENKLLNSADKYILSTASLIKVLKIEDENAVVLYGTYKTQDSNINKFSDGKIHLVYAGIIDSYKKGAFNAIEISKHLDQNYHIHILGFGEVEKLVSRIDELNKCNDCKVSYDGKLSGEVFSQFLQKCHIGLSTQALEGEYLNTSFPSKILTYLTHGLNVISGEIETIKSSPFDELITYYVEENPESIAQEIVNMKFYESKDIREKLLVIDKVFQKNLLLLLEGNK